jgi:hypothetical protein
MTNIDLEWGRVFTLLPPYEMDFVLAREILLM